MQSLEQEKFRQTVYPKRPLLICPVCKKPGYEYTKTNSGHVYAYTIHYNEPPVGISPSGHVRYKECKKGGRLYDSIEDALKGDDLKKKRIQKLKQISDCPKCHKKGRLQDYKQNGILKQVVVHEKIKGTWGTNKTPKRKRCWLGRKMINY